MRTVRVCRQGKTQAAGAVRLMPDVQEAEIQAKEEAVKTRNFSTDIMKESRRSRKQDASRNSFVKMSLGLTSPGMWHRSTSLAWMLLRTA